MKKIIFLLLLVSAVSYAGGSKIIKIDLDDKATQIVKADLDLDDIYYYMDTTACLCWVTKIVGSSNDISIFDCKNLAAYPKFEQYVSKCTNVQKIEPQVVVAEDVKVDETKKEEPKKEKK